MVDSLLHAKSVPPGLSTSHVDQQEYLSSKGEMP